MHERVSWLHVCFPYPIFSGEMLTCLDIQEHVHSHFSPPRTSSSAKRGSWGSAWRGGWLCCPCPTRPQRKDKATEPTDVSVSSTDLSLRPASLRPFLGPPVLHPPVPPSHQIGTRRCVTRRESGRPGVFLLVLRLCPVLGGL